MSSVSHTPAPVGSLFSNPSVAPPDEPRVFDYHPVPISAPTSLFFGLSGLLAFLTVAGLPVALIGLFLSAWCLLKIRRSAGEYGGSWLAGSGLALSALAFFGGTAAHSIAYATEVPEGYTRLNFTQDISKKGFVVENGHLAPHPDVAALDGQKVFLKGYMYPTRQTEGLTAFVFCRDSGDCCFGGQPKIEDMIVVRMEGERTTGFYPGMVSVAGTFKLRTPDRSAASPVAEIGEPIYEISAVLVEPSRSAF
jgi:hypothetical protein